MRQKLMVAGAAAIPGYLYWRHYRLQRAQGAAVEAENKLQAAINSDASKEDKVLYFTEAATAYAHAEAEWAFMDKVGTAGKLAIPITGIAALALLARSRR